MGTNGIELWAYEPDIPPTSANQIVSVPEVTPYRFTLSTFAFSDANSADRLQGIRLLTAPSRGLLKLGETVLDSADLGNGLVISTN